MKYLLRILLAIFILFLVLSSSFFLWAYLRHVPPILTFHQVVRSEGSSAEKIDPELFEKQMGLLKEFGYKVIRLEDLVDSLRKGIQISRKAVVITFDDGYENIYTHAYPILKRYGYPATVFIWVEKVGAPGFLTWRQMREMEENGISFGSHSLTHPYLPTAPEEKQREEIFSSKRILERRLDNPIKVFAYPVGGFNEKIKEMVKEAGYIAAVTTNRGYDPQNMDLYELNRVRISDSDSSELKLWVKYAGYSNIFEEGKKPY